MTGSLSAIGILWIIAVTVWVWRIRRDYPSILQRIQTLERQVLEMQDILRTMDRAKLEAASQRGDTKIVNQVSATGQETNQDNRGGQGVIGRNDGTLNQDQR